jgi:sulfur relay (sulfurtransferase) complex TusBCD TusD component (DsrE family)
MRDKRPLYKCILLEKRDHRKQKYYRALELARRCTLSNQSNVHVYFINIGTTAARPFKLWHSSGMQ